MPKVREELEGVGGGRGKKKTKPAQSGRKEGGPQRRGRERRAGGDDGGGETSVSGVLREKNQPHEQSGEGRRRRGKKAITTQLGEEERKRKRAREVQVADAAVSKWTPVSLSAKELLSTAMMSALGQCLEGVRGSKISSAETAIQQVMQRVELEVATARAPPTKRIRSSTDLRHRVTELKEKCMALVSRNEEMERAIEERKLFSEERTNATQQLEGPPNTAPSTHSQPTPLTEFDEETFGEHIRDLLSHTPETATHSL